MSLLPPPKVGKLRETLHAKAKRAPAYRFYALYDKVYRLDVLLYAYQCCRANDGAPGVDGQTFADVEAAGVLTWLGVLAEELRGKTYRPQTRLCRGPDEPFDFLGYTIGRCYAPQTGDSYLGVQPSAKKVRRLFRNLSAQTGRRWLWLDVDEMVGRLNQQLRGWANYFCLGKVTAAYRKVTAHACQRLRQWLVRKGVVQGALWSRYTDHHLHQRLGLLRLARPPRPSASCANA